MKKVLSATTLKGSDKGKLLEALLEITDAVPLLTNTTLITSAVLLMHCTISHKQGRTTNKSSYTKTEPDTPLEEAYHVRSYKKTSPLGGKTLSGDVCAARKIVNTASTSCNKHISM